MPEQNPFTQAFGQAFTAAQGGTSVPPGQHNSFLHNIFAGFNANAAQQRINLEAQKDQMQQIFDTQKILNEQQRIEMERQSHTQEQAYRTQMLGFEQQRGAREEARDRQSELERQATIDQQFTDKGGITTKIPTSPSAVLGGGPQPYIALPPGQEGMIAQPQDTSRFVPKGFYQVPNNPWDTSDTIRYMPTEATKKQQQMMGETWDFKELPADAQKIFQGMDRVPKTTVDKFYDEKIKNAFANQDDKALKALQLQKAQLELKNLGYAGQKDVLDIQKRQQEMAATDSPQAIGRAQAAVGDDPQSYYRDKNIQKVIDAHPPANWVTPSEVKSNDDAMKGLRSARKAVEQIGLIRQLAADPEVQNNIGVISGNLNEKLMKVGATKNLSASANEKVGRMAQALTNLYFREASIAATGGRLNKTILDQIANATPHLKDNPALFNGLLKGVEDNVRLTLDEYEDAQYPNGRRPDWEARRERMMQGAFPTNLPVSDRSKALASKTGQ